METLHLVNLGFLQRDDISEISKLIENVGLCKNLRDLSVCGTDFKEEVFLETFISSLSELDNLIHIDMSYSPFKFVNSKNFIKLSEVLCRNRKLESFVIRTMFNLQCQKDFISEIEYINKQSFNIQQIEYDLQEGNNEIGFCVEVRSFILSILKENMKTLRKVDIKDNVLIHKTLNEYIRCNHPISLILDTLAGIENLEQLYIFKSIFQK